jgi:hypothetical protein
MGTRSFPLAVHIASQPVLNRVMCRALLCPVLNWYQGLGIATDYVHMYVGKG